MKTRWFIPMAALLALSCSTGHRNSALVVTKLVLGTATTNPGPPAVTTCSYEAASPEFDFAQIDPTANTGGTMGVVVQNNLTDPTQLNPILRTNSATFHPHQVVADYEMIGGTTVTMQIIPVSGASIPAGTSGAVLVPFFAPIPTTTLTGLVRVIFHIEGNLDDGSNVRTSQAEYVFVTCNTAGCNSACL
jgi:hypothetical protein